MDIRRITENYAVSPQIEPADLPAIAAAGFRRVICNRPDAEVPHELSAEVMETAAVAAGLSFVVIPVTHQTLNMDMVAQQMEAVESADGPALAYCASGTRSTIVWSLGSAGKVPTQSIIDAAARAGYDLQGLRPRLEALAR